MSLSNNGVASILTADMPGFSAPVFDSQSVFRAALMAMSRPGQQQRIQTRAGALIGLPDIAGVHTASLAWILALADLETPVWLDERLRGGDLPRYLRFHTGAEITDARQSASFVLFREDYHSSYFDDFPVGLDDCPETSATLIVQVADFTSGAPRTMRGPGIPSTVTIQVSGIRDQFWKEWQVNNDLYPCGVDVVFTAGDTVMGLPRSVAEGE